MKKFKDWKNWLKGKTARMGMALSAAAVALCGAASAAEGETGGTATVISSLETGIQGFANDALSMIGKIVVIAIPIAGTIWLARKAIGWFKSMGGK